MKTSKSLIAMAFLMPRNDGFLRFYLFFIIIIFSIFQSGCGHHHSGTIVIPEEVHTLKLRGNVNLNNIKFPTSLCGNNTYQFIDLSVFNITIQDDLQHSAYVSSNGEFSFPELDTRQQIVIFCKNTNNPNLSFEWMSASTNGLFGQTNITIDLYSTARSLIARSLRDRYGRRVKPEYISDEYIKDTVDAILEVIEKNPDLLTNTPLSEIESVKSAYTKMADLLNSGGSGAYPNDHVFLFYFAGDNDLGLYMENTVNSIAEAGLPSDTQIIIGLDTFNSLPLLNKAGAARYKVNSNKLQLLNDIGKVDSTDSIVLEKFIEVSMREYPAKGYSLILSSHGGGWRGRERTGNSNRAMFMNDTDSLATGTLLNTAIGIETALKSNNATNRKFDLIVLDSCNMGSIETAYELGSLTDYIVFSEALMPASGIPYGEFFKEISNKGVTNLSKYDKAKILCDLFDNKYIDKPNSIDTGISIIDNSEIEHFMDCLNNYINVIYSKKDIYCPIIYNLRTSTTTNDGEENTGGLIQNFSPLNEFIDLKHLTYKSHDVLLDAKIESDALKACYDSLIKYSKYSNGISITFPEKDVYNMYYSGILPADEYFNLKFNKLTNWNELLEAMLKE